MHILGIKWHAKFSPCSLFFSIKPPKKTANRKITPFEAHMQEKMQFTAYLRGFTNTQPPRHLKGFLFLSKLSLISFPIEDGKLKKNGAKSTCQKSNLECWQNCLWFSIVFHCSFFGFSLVFLWFSLVFP
jgi:hypothetical protein